MRSIRIATLPAATLIVIALTGCATSPTGRDQLVMFSPAAMTEMGAAAFEEIKTETPIAGAYLNRYVGCVTDAIVAVLPDGGSQDWEVKVFDEDAPNAFALPGKKIGVYKGLLDVTETQDQLAAVIGHEIGAQVGILLPYSRSHESEADRIGLEVMAQAGFDPAASVDLWRNMSRAGGGRAPEFLSTHPAPETRIRALQTQIPVATKLYQEAREAGRVPDCDG